jgi:hypothetical protein
MESSFRRTPASKEHSMGTAGIEFIYLTRSPVGGFCSREVYTFLIVTLLLIKITFKQLSVHTSNWES